MRSQRTCRSAGVGFLAVAIAALAGCGRAGGTSEGVPASLPAQHAPLEAAPGVERVAHRALAPAADLAEPIPSIERLRKRGQFDEFINAALNAADDQPERADLELLKTEALLAGGNPAAAEACAERAATLAFDSGAQSLAVSALKLWILARFRQAKPLDSDTVAELAVQLPSDDSGAQMVRFWIEQLADRAPYALGGVEENMQAEIPLTRAAAGTIWADLNAIEARANGVPLPMVFIDTGAQATIMTRRAAEKAGVLTGPSAAQLVGFAGGEARPAVLETLDLGELVLHDVPLLVADTPALMTANGQMGLGTELMHHVRFTLDYPARRVLAERADRPSSVTDREPGWDIPLWTFSQTCLARADDLDGTAARVLVDTGNRSGSFVSAGWARRHLPQFQRPTSSLIFKFRHQGLRLDTMSLGTSTLRNWPIIDRLPSELERLDLVDVLVGRDVLWPYRLTIDLRQRVMRLRGGPQSPVPPVETIP
jgi:hypothetical protein